MGKKELMETKKLGFGFMRLPLKDGVVDEESVNRMVDNYLESGFNYFDTAYLYHGGTSENFLKKTLVERHPRENYTIADKLPGWCCKSNEDARKIFAEQLEKTGAGYFDFYLLHAITVDHLKDYDNYDCWNLGKELKEKGLIKNFGFSFHDTPELLDEILTKHPEVDFVQLQINYADWDSKSVHSKDCFEIAKKHGVPVAIMEPVKGGNLAIMHPDLEAKMKAVCPDNSIASWAMRFCASLDNVYVILSGSSSEEQLMDNIKTMTSTIEFSAEEAACLDEVREELAKSPIVQCTSCSYCTDGCPIKINIPDVFKIYNNAITYRNDDMIASEYANITRVNGKAGDCIECGQCESACPQKLPIIELLKKASARLD